MNINRSYIRNHLSPIFLVVSTIVCLIISIYCLQIGYTIIFQNLFYIPIISACVFYTRKGFVFSCFLAFVYFGLIAGYTSDNAILMQAFIRVILFVGIAGVVTFLTETGKKSEKILRRLSSFQENIITNAHVMLIVLDHKGTIFLWNTAAEEISGYSAEEVTHKNDIWKLLYPEKESRHQITETIARIIRDEHYIENFETTIQTKQGDKKVISWNTKSILDETGRNVQFIAIGVDVTDRHLTELKLQDSEERFRLVFEHLPIGLWMADKTGTLLMGNPAGQKIWGGDPHIGQDQYRIFKACRLPSHELIKPDDWALGYAVNEGRITEAELLEIESFDGSHKIILNWAGPVKNPHGEIVGAFVINQDITRIKRDEELLNQRNETLLRLTEDLKASEEKLKSQLEEIQLTQNKLLESEERWSDLFIRNHSAIAVYQVIDGGKDFIFVDFNPAGEAIERVNRDDIIGRRVTEVFPGVIEFGILDVFRRVWRTGTPETHQVSLYKDNRVQGWRENLVYRLSSGEIVAMYNDVTQRKCDEELIRETNAYLDNLISIANVPIIIWDKSFLITRLNHAGELLIGRSADEVVGKSFDTLFPPDNRDKSMRLLQTTLEGVRWDTVEIDILHKDGSIRNVLWSSATLYTSDGSGPVATIAQGRDITEELRLEKEKAAALVQIQKNLAQLAILNDEIRNPLAIIMAYADLSGNAQITKPIIDQIKNIDEIVNHLDQRWIQSEKVLNAIRKHYHLYVSPSEKPPEFFDSDTLSDAQFTDIHYPDQAKDEVLIEEIQAELYTILDSIDALIYVADMDTYELLYVNRRARSLFGDIVGKKCFRTIYKDMNGPCPFCTNAFLLDSSGPTGVYAWEVQNSMNGRWYDCRDRAIRWTDGRIVRLEIATDITERKNNEEKLQKTIEELRQFNALTVGREIRMRDLKSEVNELLTSAGKQEKYLIEK